MKQWYAIWSVGRSDFVLSSVFGPFLIDNILDSYRICVAIVEGLVENS